MVDGLIDNWCDDIDWGDVWRGMKWWVTQVVVLGCSWVGDGWIFGVNFSEK